MTVVDEFIALLGYDVRNEAELKRFNKSLDQLEKKAFKVGQAIGKMAVVAGAAVATGFTFLGKSVLDTAAKFETYAATLETIEGSTEKATAALDWIKDFAKTTPYEVDELTAAFVKLRSYGLDPMDGTMTVLGDTAAGMGKRIDQVVEALADASTFQFERLRELGIVASQAGDKVTFSWTENGKSMTKTIKKTSSEVTKFLNEIWNKKFNGAMIKQSKTWTGMMSNLGDSWTQFQLRISEAGFFDAVKNKLGQVMDAVARWEADGTLDKIAKTLSNGFVAAADAIGAVITQISGHIAYLNKNFEALEPWIKTVAIALGLLMLAAFPVATAIGAIGLVVDDFLTYMQGGESIIGNFIQWIKDLIPGATEAEDAIAKLAAAITVALAAAFVIAPATMTGIVMKIVTSFTGLLITKLVIGIAALSAPLAGAFATLFALLATPVGWAVILAGVAAALIAYFWDDLQKLWAEIDFAQLGRDIGNGILNGLKSAGAAISAFFASLMPDWLSSMIAGEPVVGSGGAVGAGEPVVGSGKKVSGSGKPLIDLFGNANDNAAKVNGAQNGAGVVQDNSTKTQTTNVTAPVTVHVQTPTQAPAAVGNAISGAVKNAAQPSRMQSGNAF